MGKNKNTKKKSDANVHIGIDADTRKQIADGLSVVLAESYMLYLKTHGYHWNVTGPFFSSLHAMFEIQYTELALAIDEIAERIRAIGFYAPSSLSEFSKLSAINEDSGVPKAMDMVQNLASDNEHIIETCRKILPLCSEFGDEASTDTLTQRLHAHSKTAWMLRSHLAE
jgi:starvation-inducible DNA-binding protein